ncbi:MAG: MATE family efflux transporter [Deltaproteobacteria bacterium]|nr:MATE family efflux transporter [Deltaproteobacteria bacterium]
MSSTTNELRTKWKSIFSFDWILSKEIIFIAAPVVGAMLAQALVNQADSIMVGRLPASDSVPGQSAVGLTVKILWAIGGFLSAIAVGTQAITARRNGEHNPHAAGNVLSSSLTVAVITSGVASVIGFILGPEILRIISGNDPEIMRVGAPFIRIRLLGIFTMVVTTSYKAFFDGLGKTTVHFYASILMNATNILLNYMFIYGKFGAPRWGVHGAATASVLSTVVGLGVMVYFSAKKTNYSTYRYYKKSSIRSSVMWSIVKLSLPSGIATFLLMGGFLIVDWVVGGIGTGEMRTINQTANQIIITIMMPFLMTCVAFGTATSTLVSRSLGEKDTRKAERYGWESVKIWGGVMLVLGLLVGIWPEILIKLFNSSEVRLVEAASGPLRVIGFMLPVAAMGVVLMQAHFGAGNTLFVMIVEFVSQFLVLIPMSVILGRVLKLGLIGVWGPIIIYISMIAFLMTITFFRGKWKKIKI